MHERAGGREAPDVRQSCRWTGSISIQLPSLYDTWKRYHRMNMSGNLNAAPIAAPKTMPVVRSVRGASQTFPSCVCAIRIQDLDASSSQNHAGAFAGVTWYSLSKQA